MADEPTVPKWIEKSMDAFWSEKGDIPLDKHIAKAYREFVREKAKEIAESLDHYTFVDEKARDIEAIILRELEVEP